MQIIVTKQIEVEADSIEEGLAAAADGKGEIISVNAIVKPQPAKPSPFGKVVTRPFQGT